MRPRKVHRLVGILLLLPFVAWASTAIFFLVRPAYTEAYEQLQVRQLSMGNIIQFVPDPAWLEARFSRTVLGEHLLVRDAQGWQHLDSFTLDPRPGPTGDELRLLIDDATRHNPARYGTVQTLSGLNAVTDTGVEISVDWDSLRMSQRGPDTRWIDRIYDIHYLRWTGFEIFDRIFGLFGLFLLMYMTYSGARMALGRR
ncbi:MAG: hypothetical protein CMQ34_06600 [Gammaproteobacteria bacterium]|nr:hypothetical protein [Gammaproteobacteria bacterium]|tara:strand:+ start:378 stop:974 length:597 start_codon:yes stop_codon:yes gene_type:complete